MALQAKDILSTFRKKQAKRSDGAGQRARKESSRGDLAPKKLVTKTCFMTRNTDINT